MPKFVDRQKLETVEEQSNCDSPERERVDFKDLFSPTDYASNEKLDGFEQARTYKLSGRTDAAQLNFFKEIVSEA